MTRWGYGSLVAGQAIARTTTYRVRRASSLVLSGIGLLLVTLDITGAVDVPSVALFMFLAPALAVSPVRIGGVDDAPSHLPRWARPARIVQIFCLVVGFVLGATQVFGPANSAVTMVAMLMFGVSIVLTLVLTATSWPAARPQEQH
jgi:hypothetical protein